MLIDCPEGCGYKVSDLALACPRCGYPVREQLALAAEQRANGHARAIRKQIGETDCPRCEARGFYNIYFKDFEGNSEEGFEWCALCECTGRIVLCESSAGYYAVGDEVLAGFLGGELDPDEENIFYLGTKKPEGHKYPKAGKRFKVK